VDIWTYIGTIGIFTSLFLLFIRFLPMIAMSEVKTAVPEADPHFGLPPVSQSLAPDGKERAP
jgi:molybdopterin-containing oxidoreductase family membrane subunit